MRTTKLLILWVARAMGLFRAARWITRNGIVIIGWHGVSMNGEHSRIPSYFVTADQLAARLGFLIRHYEVVSVAQAVDQKLRREIKPRQVVLTFDDGMRNFITSAKPVLDTYNAVATVYALSSSVDKTSQSYPLLIRDLFQLSSRAVCEIPRGSSHQFTLSTPRDREKAADAAIGWFMRCGTDDAARKRFLSDLARELDVNLDNLESEKTWYYMDGQELAALSSEGVSIQAHSHRHINCVDELEKVYEDTVTCKQLLEEVTSCKVHHYCYPSGFWSKDVWPQLERAGMISAVTCNTGPNYADTPSLALRRFIDHHLVSQLEFEFAVSGLRWLLHRIAHPFESQTPREKRSNPGPNF